MMNEPVNISERRRPWKAPICDSSARGKGTTLKEQTGARTGKEKQTEPNTLRSTRPWAPAGRWSPHQARHSRARCPANLAAGLSGLSFGDRREKREEAHWHLPCTRCFPHQGAFRATALSRADTREEDGRRRPPPVDRYLSGTAAQEACPH